MQKSNKHRAALFLLLTMPLGAATVKGTVTDAVSNLPVPRAHVALMGSGNGKPITYGATSDAGGDFSFTAIAPGSYSTTADRIGYVDQMTTPQDRVRITLKEDDNKTDVVIRLIPTGAITGRVTDSDGGPLENAHISAQGSRGGGDSETDEKGQFRIGGLAPGKYKIRAMSGSDVSSLEKPEIRTDGTSEVHNAATYYPGVVAAKEAGRIDVQAGVETPGADIKLVRVPFVRVSGRVVDLPHGVHPEIEIGQENESTGFGINSDGTFELWRLDPGKYTLSADWQTPGGEDVRTMAVEIEVAGSNIDNIELRIVPPSDISGHLEYEDDDAKQQPAQNQRQGPENERMVILEALVSDNFGEGGAPAPIAADGSFQLKKIPGGKYHVRLSWDTAYVKSVTLGSTSTDGAILDLSKGSGGADLTLLLAAPKSSISGTVQGDTTDTEVALTDADDRYMELMAEIKADGTYLFEHLPPGNYRIGAIPGPVYQIGDFEDQMETVEVGADDKITKDLKRLTTAP